MAQLAGVLREQGRNGEAIEASREVLARQPENAAAQCELGLCLEVARDLEGAERAFRGALRLDDGQSVASGQLGGILARSGRSEEAAGLFEKALATHPDVAPLHNNLATASVAGSCSNRAICPRRSRRSRSAFAASGSWNSARDSGTGGKFFL